MFPTSELQSFKRVKNRKLGFPVLASQSSKRSSQPIRRQNNERAHAYAVRRPGRPGRNADRRPGPRRHSSHRRATRRVPRRASRAPRQPRDRAEVFFEVSGRLRHPRSSRLGACRGACRHPTRQPDEAKTGAFPIARCVRAYARASHKETASACVTSAGCVTPSRVASGVANFSECRDILGGPLARVEDLLARVPRARVAWRRRGAD